MVYFTSDLHIGHNSIHKYRTKFSSAEENHHYCLDLMSKLNKRDILIILGDFIFDCSTYDRYVEDLNKMSCRIKLLMGNHDTLLLHNTPKVEIQLPLYTYKGMWLSHCPIHPQEIRGRKGNVHGHLHQSSLNDSRYFNVNINANDYKFVPLEVLKERFSNKEI
jgi:calcineurin-like phosphoesterase family protein